MQTITDFKSSTISISIGYFEDGWFSPQKTPSQSNFIISDQNPAN